MNIMELGAMGEFIAAVAVVLSLGYLGFKIRQSNALSRSQTRQNMMELSQQSLYKLLDDPTIFTAMTEESVSLEQKIKLQTWLTVSMRHREFEWFTQRDRVADAAMTDAYLGVIPIVLGNRRTRAWWYGSRERSFDPQFAAFVDEVLEQSPYTDFFDLEALDGWSTVAP